MCVSHFVSNVIARQSAWAKLSCQVPSLFGSKSAWTRHDATFQCTTAILGRSVNCVRMTWLLDIFLVAGWKCHSCLHSFEFLHDLFKTVQGQFHSTARSLQHSSIGRCRTGIRLLVVRLLHWAIPFFPARQVPFGSLSLGWHPLIERRYLKVIDVIYARFWCEFSRNCFLQPFQASCWEH